MLEDDATRRADDILTAATDDRLNRYLTALAERFGRQPRHLAEGEHLADNPHALG